MAVDSGVTDQGPTATDAAIGILVFDGVEVLDFAGPFEVFSVSRRDEARRAETASPLPPVLVGVGPGTVRATGGMMVTPHCSLEQLPNVRALIIPGGHGVRPLLSDTALLDGIRRRAGRLDVLMSICTGAALLAAAGLLKGRRATTHHRYLDWLAELEPDCEVLAEQRFVDEGALITAGGIAAGMDAALHLVERWEGEAVARATADYMEYPRD